MTNNMKRHIALLYTFMMLGAACTKVETDIAVNPDDAVSFRSAEIETKVYYEDSDKAIKVKWNANDRIGVFAQSEGGTQGNIAYKAATSGASTDFLAYDTGSIIRWKDAETSHSFFAYYPYDGNAGETPEAVSVSLPAIQAQDGPDNMGHLQNYDFLYAATCGIRQDDYEEVTLQFSHLFTMLDISIAPSNDIRSRINAVEIRCRDSREMLAFNSADIDLGTGKIDNSSITGGSSSIRLECGFLTNYDKSYQHFYMAMTPGHDGKEFDIVAILDSGEEFTVATKTAPSGGFQAALYSISGKFTPTVEAAKIDLCENGTANTYIVNKGSTLYTFNATVKGNGIERDFYSSYLEQDLAIDPKSVLVLWYNCLQTDAKWKDMEPIVVKNTYLKDGKVVLETPFSFVEGNAVIVAFEEDGVTYDSIMADADGIITNATVLWSWNIWAVKDYDPEASAVQFGDYFVMDRNLGALRNSIPEDDDNLKTFIAPSTVGNYYQWGRKDPFPYHADSRNYYPFYHNNLAVTPTYTPIKALQNTIKDKDGYVLEKQIFSNEGVTNTSANATKVAYVAEAAGYEACVERAIRNPHKFISDKSIFPRWVDTSLDETRTLSLWGDPTNGDTDDAKKSIYDPCPAGWRLWTRQTALELREKALKDTPVSNDYGFRVAGTYFAVNGGGRAATNMMFNLGWMVQPQAGVNFMGWTATADCLNYMNGYHQKWYNWTLEQDKTTLLMSEETTQSNSGNAIGRTVRCVKMHPEVDLGGDGGMRGEDGEEEYEWYE